MYKKIICIAATVLLTVTAFIGNGISAAKNEESALEALEDKLAAATSQRKNAEKAVADAENGYKDALWRKKAIDSKIYAVNLEIDAINQLIQGYNVKIEIKNSEIDAVSANLEEQYETVKERIRAKHEDGSSDWLSIFLKADGIEDLLLELDRFKYMLEYDQSLLTSYTNGLSELEAMRDELESAKESLNRQIKDLEALSASLEADLTSASKLVATAENKLSSAEKDLKIVEATEAEYNKKREELLIELKHTSNEGYVGGEFLWPLPTKYTRISSGFGWRIHPVTGADQFHRGIDIPAPYGTDIYAVNSGTVVECSYNYADGYYITISHGGGLASFYSHLSKYKVKVGDKVEKGQVIANVGTSGYTTGAHLNLNIYENGSPVNPTNFFN